MERRTRRRTIEAVFATGTRPMDYSWYRWMILERASAGELVLEDTLNDGGTGQCMLINFVEVALEGVTMPTISRRR
jgi:hypothetical protein